MLVNMVRGANAPLVEQRVKEHINILLQGLTHKPVLPFNILVRSG
jgi:hypothetical protein